MFGIPSKTQFLAFQAKVFYPAMETQKLRMKMNTFFDIFRYCLKKCVRGPLKIGAGDQLRPLTLYPFLKLKY